MLTLNAARRDKWCGQDHPNVVWSSRFPPRRLDRSVRLSRSRRSAAAAAAAAGRPHLKEGVGIGRGEKAAVILQHRSSQVIDGVRIHSLSDSARGQQSVVRTAEIIGDSGQRCRCHHDDATESPRRKMEEKMGRRTRRRNGRGLLR